MLAPVQAQDEDIELDDAAKAHSLLDILDAAARLEQLEREHTKRVTHTTASYDELQPETTPLTWRTTKGQRSRRKPNTLSTFSALQKVSSWPAFMPTPHAAKPGVCCADFVLHASVYRRL